MYARTKYVLLDDPLNAIVRIPPLFHFILSYLLIFLSQDGHTARFLYERLLCGPLLNNRTVVGLPSNPYLEAH